MSFATPESPRFDIVFDIDWTLFYPVESRIDDHTVSLPEGNFRMADGVIESLITLHQQGHRISLFSGGTASRNHALSAHLTQLVFEKGLFDFQFYKILSFEDLSRRPGSKDDSKFLDMWMKDLRKVNPDLQRVILVDDSKFSVPGQDRNLYWIQRTYNFQSTFGSYVERDGYDAPSYQEWIKERRKIVRFTEDFSRASAVALTEDPLKALWEYHLDARACRELF